MGRYGSGESGGPGGLDTRRRSWVLLGAIVLSSSWLLLRGLNNDYITLFDEAVHFNVVQNLITHCCTPRLHVGDVHTDFRDWTDNHVWLHKPPVPLLVNAGVASRWPRSPRALRMASLIFAEALVVLVFLVGIRFFDPWVAVLGAAAFGFNRYTFDLVQGRQFSGIPDLTLAFCLLCALYCLLAIVESPKRRYFVAFGVFSGLGFLCKDGLAFIPFLVLGLVILELGWRRHALAFAYAAAIALAIAGTSTAYLTWHFPVEARYEQHMRLAHLFSDVEGWARPPDYYFTVYFTRVTSTLIVGVAYLCVGWGLLLGRRRLSIGVLALWVVTYLVALAPAVTKISNFIYPTVPVLYLLLAAAIVNLWRSERYHHILAGCAVVLISAVIFQFDVFGSHRWIVHSHSYSPARFILFQCGMFGLCFAAMRRVRVRPPILVTGLSVVAAVAVVLGASIRANLAAPHERPVDYQQQMALREAALALPPEVRQDDDVVLVKWEGVRKSHLYVRFWGGVESLEVRPACPLEAQLALVKRVPRVYLLADSPAAPYRRPVRVGPGYLYKIR
jgi:4-amino-4-deoxy-L-arabinose transferase-like glycosyltransferase